jgi:hypothetical protein
VEGSSPERHLHGGAIEAEGLTGARPKEGWVAPVVGLESRLFVGRCSVVHNTAGNQRGGNVPWSISVVCWDGEVRCISGILVMVPVGSDGGRRWGGTGEGPWRSEELGVWCFGEDLWLGNWDSGSLWEAPGDAWPGGRRQQCLTGSRR